MSKKGAMRANKSRSQLTKADKAAIKEEQASFLEKMRTAEPNAQQETIFAAARSGQGHYVVLAGPGSGKTFTSIRASTSFTGRSMYCSYNRKIAFDTNEKLIAIDSPMIATTAHSFGLSCLMAFTRGKCVVDNKEEKYPTIIKQYMGEQWGLFAQSIQEQLEEGESLDVMRLDAESWSESLIHYAQVSLTKADKAGLSRLVEEFDLSEINRTSLVWDFVIEVVFYAIEAGLQQFLEGEHLVSFDDMIYYPNVISGVPVWQFDHLIVDEAQDTSRAALELMLKACHAGSQFFAVGDPKQNIYRFSGAAEDSIGQIIERLHAQTLPLKIVYRCGSTIVDLANQLCSEDEQLISAGQHQGHVEVIAVAEYIERLRPGHSAVLGRTTKKLVQGCLKALQAGKKAKVLGRNIGDNIAAVVTRLEARRVKRGEPELQPDLCNLLQMLSEYKTTETQSLKESRQNPEMAIAELADKIETCRAFFEAYVGKCHDPGQRVLDDPPCAFNKTAKDFKAYIRGLFSDEEGSKDFILFMTAHRSKGGEWEDIFIIGTEEFPHPKAKSESQHQQEENLMYVAITRAIHNLYFVGAPFACLKVPGYEPHQGGLTIISYPAAGLFEIHDGGRETREPSVYDAPGFEDYDPEVVDTLFRDSLGVSRVDEAEFRRLKDLGEALHAERSDQAFLRGMVGEETFSPEEVVEGELVTAVEAEQLVEGRASRIVAIEVLCPACGSPCVDRALESPMITYELVGHTVVCSACGKACIVPLNAFSLSGNVIARERPAAGVTNSKVEKKGRTQKERKNKAGRKPVGKGVRQPMQLSLDSRVVTTLNAMGINKSALFVELLQQYEPFLDTWAELGHDGDGGDEFDHDQIDDEGE